MELAIIGVAAIFGLTAMQCFRIKYVDDKDLDKLRKEVEALKTNLDSIDAETIKDLRAEVQGLKNHYGLARKR